MTGRNSESDDKYQIP